MSKDKFRIRIEELQVETGVTDKELSAALWPESNKRVRYEMLRNWENKPVGSIKLEQLQALSELFETTNLSKLIEKL
jgi:hypothetical protein